MWLDWRTRLFCCFKCVFVILVSVRVVCVALWMTIRNETSRRNQENISTNSITFTIVLTASTFRKKMSSCVTRLQRLRRRKKKFKAPVQTKKKFVAHFAMPLQPRLKALAGILKTCADKLVYIFSLIFNQCFASGHIPTGIIQPHILARNLFDTNVLLCFMDIWILN